MRKSACRLCSASQAFIPLGLVTCLGRCLYAPGGAHNSRSLKLDHLPHTHHGLLGQEVKESKVKEQENMFNPFSGRNYRLRWKTMATIDAEKNTRQFLRAEGDISE